MRKLLVASAVAALCIAGAAMAGGQFTNQLPGASTYGPFGGAETLPVDTNLAGGAMPQTVSATVTQLAGGVRAAAGMGTSYNLLRGGDFGTNPWQRGTSGTGITTSNVYTADGWGVISGTSTSAQWSQQTGASDIVPGSAATLRVQRTSGQTGVVPVCVQQILESSEVARLQGHKAVLQFQARYGANFSSVASGSNYVANGITAWVSYGTGNAANNTMSNFLGAAWTGNVSLPAVPIALASTFSNTGNASAAPTTYYMATPTLPTGITEFGVQLCYTPSGTAGANDWFEFTLAQLAVNDNGYPVDFGYRTAQQELAIAQRYFYALSEPASAVGVGFSGNAVTTTTCNTSIAFPVTMRAAPTFTALGTALSASTWKVNYAATSTTLASTFYVTTTANTPNAAFGTWTISAANLVAGGSCFPVGANGGSILSWSADL